MSDGSRRAVFEEQRIDEDFRERYLRNDHDAAREVEWLVLGTDYGVTGYTTLALVDRLLDSLDLSPSDRLLDIGTGCGWPGLRAASERHCRVVGVDLPLDGLVRGMARARRDDLTDRFSTARCSARQLPFRPRSFDRIIHTDVLC